MIRKQGFTLIEILAATALASVLILTLLFVISTMERTHRMLINRDERNDDHAMLIDLVRNDLYHARKITLPEDQKKQKKENTPDPQSPEELLRRHKEMLRGLSPDLARQLAVHLKRDMGIDITQDVPREKKKKEKKELSTKNLNKDMIIIEGYYGLDRENLEVIHRPARLRYRVIELGEHRCLVREQEVLGSKSNRDTYLEILDIGVNEFEVRVPEIEEEEGGNQSSFTPTQKQQGKNSEPVQPDYAILKLTWVDDERQPIEELILMR